MGLGTRGFHPYIGCSIIVMVPFASFVQRFIDIPRIVTNVSENIFEVVLFLLYTFNIGYPKGPNCYSVKDSHFLGGVVVGISMKVSFCMCLLPIEFVS